MKKINTLLLALVATASLHAQTYMRMWQGLESKRLTIAEMGDMTFNGSTIDIAGTPYNLSDIDSLVVVPEIGVTWNGAQAHVNIPASIQADVTVSTDGEHVTITNNNASNEVEVLLQGSSDNGSLTYNGVYKATVRLNGLNLTSQRGAAIDIQDGKRIALVLTEGTFNTLTDASGGTHKAALYCDGHLEVEGGGCLTVSGNTGHAISSNEYMQLKRSTGTITILKAVKDAIHCGQNFEMRGGIVSWNENTQGDGIQAELEMQDDDITPKDEPENTGAVNISGGQITGINMGETTKGIRSDGIMTISGGTINLAAKGDGSRGIQADGDLTIGNETAETTITISAEGARWTNPDDATDTTRCAGIRAKGNMTVNGGTITVTNTGSKSRGIHVDGTYTKNGGTVNATIVTA